MKARLAECAENAEELVPLLIALAESLGQTAEQGGAAHPDLERILSLAVTLRSDLRRLAKYAEALEE